MAHKIKLSKSLCFKTIPTLIQRGIKVPKVNKIKFQILESLTIFTIFTTKIANNLGYFV